MEVLYLGTIMHDIGLVEGMIHEPRRFEVVGADFARSHLLEQGLDERRADVVWDVIALHSSVGIADYKGVEVALAHLGISVDVVGRGLEERPTSRSRASSNSRRASGSRTISWISSHSTSKPIPT